MHDKNYGDKFVSEYHRKSRKKSRSGKSRNPSKNTIKKLMRPTLIWPEYPGNGYRATNYYLHNEVGARVYIVSKGEICNLEPKGVEKYLVPKNPGNGQEI